MTKTPANRRSRTAGARSAARWSQTAIIASAVVFGASAPSRANDIGAIFGAVSGVLNTMQSQPRYYAPQPQYYQQPQYQQPQYHQYRQSQQPQTYQRQPSGPSAEQRRQAEIKRQKAQQEKKEQEQASLPAVPAQTGNASGTIDVAMTRKNGNLWVPANINSVVTIDFVIDSGASDITLPRDVYLTLIRSGTLTKANYVGSAHFGIADGSEVKGLKFKLASLQVGNQVLKDVVASVMPSDSATPLLGLSFLSRFQSWAIDNNSGMLKLTPMGAAATTQTANATRQTLPEPPAAPAAAAPTAAAAAPAAQAQPAAVAAAATPAPAAPTLMAVTTQPQTDAPTTGNAATPAPQETAPAQAAAAQAQPEPAPAAAPMPHISAAAVSSQQSTAAELKVAVEAPRSGRVASSAFMAKQTSAETPHAATAEAKAETKPVVPVFPPNTPYANARTSLMALGYGPAPLPDSGKCDANTDSTCFPERAACAKADSIQCEFFWRRGDQLIKVRTVAVPPTIAAVECQVNCK